MKFSRLKCVFIPEAIDGEWDQSYQMEAFPLTSFGISMAPNGIDVWLSGGLSWAYVENTRIGIFPLKARINIVRYLHNTFV